jgi:HAMP domain-containing protein
VAREVGTEGKLGGQAEVEGVSGTWRRLTENVNQLAVTLTTQLRAIAEVSTAVTQGDLTRSISVEAQGEVAELKDNINQMIANLRETTQLNAEQDWLKTNLASISGMLQGQRDLAQVTQLIMSEVTPMVNAQHGGFFLAEPTQDDGSPELMLVAAYGYTPGAAICATDSTSARGWSARPRSSARQSRSPTSRPATSRSDPAWARRARPTSWSCRCCSRIRCSASSSSLRCGRSPRSTATSWPASRRRSAWCSTRSAPTCARRSC